MTTETGIPFEQICPYLPYGLKSFRIFGGQPLHGEIHVGNVMNFVNNETAYKPVLRPMSDATKVLKYDDGMYAITDIINEYTSVDEMEYGTFTTYVEKHFDVFDLLSKGLAISIHDIDKK